MARIDVPMPQMGESIAEGTVSKWLKAVGDRVERDEPILEISTDKVDAEIPAPSGGWLIEVVVSESETVEVGTTVAIIDTEAPSAGSGDETAASPTLSAAEDNGAPQAGAAARPDTAAPDRESGDGASSLDERLRTRSTPVVRKIAAEHDVNVADVEGTGHMGRVTKKDILAHIETAASAPSSPATPRRTRSAPTPSGAGASAPTDAAPSDLWERFHREVEHPRYPVRSSDRVEAMDKIRRLTAEHMVVAKRVAPHVHSFIEIDFSAIDRVRKARKAAWAERGAKVSYTAFVAWAVARLLRDFPTVNSAVSGNEVIFRGNVNLGMAVDLNPGLIVPVVHDADDLSLAGIGRRMVDLAERARGRTLLPSEIQGATFTITNPGVLGTLAGLPVIPKGTSAILGTGAIEKRVVAVEDPVSGTDSIVVRKRSIFTLGYDHRIVDGADSARFLSALKAMLESFPEDV